MNAPVDITALAPVEAEAPRRFVIQHVWADCMVPARYTGTFPSLLEAYEFITECILIAGGFVKHLLANPHLGVACVHVRVHGEDQTYLITPDEAEYTPSNLKRAKSRITPNQSEN